MSLRGLRARNSIITYGLLILLTVFSFFPLFWMLSTSVKPSNQIYTVPPTWIATKPVVEHYSTVLSNALMRRYFTNSLIVAGVTTLVACLLGIFAGYGFARFTFPFKRWMYLFVLATRMFPLVVYIVPLYLLISQTVLMDTFAGLVAVYSILTLPLAIWLFKGFFQSIPSELEEAALVDGCSRVGMLFRIIIPVSTPGIVAVGMYTFLVAWNEYLLGLVFSTSVSVRPITVGLATYMEDVQTDWGALMALGVLMTLPATVIYAVSHKYIVKGLTEGSVKG